MKRKLPSVRTRVVVTSVEPRISRTRASGATGLIRPAKSTAWRYVVAAGPLSVRTGAGVVVAGAEAGQTSSSRARGRARRTAEILLENWHGTPAPELVVEERLTPECKPRKLLRVLRDVPKERVAVVGHQPDIGIWAAWLIGSKKAYINFAKAGVAHIVWERDLKKGGGSLDWLITPQWFDKAPAVTPRLAAGEH